MDRKKILKCIWPWVNVYCRRDTDVAAEVARKNTDGYDEKKRGR